MADVREKVEQIRQAIYGIEVRESIASGIEAINTEVESTTQRQTTLETDMAEAKREAEEAATRANTAAGDAEDITEAMAIWEEYDPEKDYVPLNKTTYQGSSYINVLACKGVPPTEETHWLPIASKGDQGVPGPMPTLVVGDTTTLSPGSAATVTRRAGSPDAAPVIDFGIPRGVDGTGYGDMSKVIYDDNDDGKVNAADIADAVPTGAITDDMLSNDPNHIKARLNSHMAEDASLSAKGHVQLYDGTDSTSTALAATANAVKAAMDKANQAFQSASDGKSLISGAITGVDPSVEIPTDPTFAELVAAIGQISTGKKYAEGTKSNGTTSGLTISNLTFTPAVVIIHAKETASGKWYLHLFNNKHTVAGAFEMLGASAWSDGGEGLHELNVGISTNGFFDAIIKNTYSNISWYAWEG